MLLIKINTICKTNKHLITGVSNFKNNCLFLGIFFILFAFTGKSQPGYTFAGATTTYTAITGGTVFANSGMANMDETVSGAITIPSFNYNCNTYTAIYISTNGYITFSSAPNTFDYTPISGTVGYSGALCPFATDVDASTIGGTPEIRYQDVTASNEFVVQWQDVSRYGVADRISFQVRLNYSTNVIKFMYGGTITAANNTTLYPQVGIRGADNTSYLNRTTTTNWSATTAGGTNAVTCQYKQTVKPAVGLTNTFTPSNMVYSSATSSSVASASIEKCATNIPMLRVDIVNTGGCQNPLTLTTFSVNMTGTTPTTVVSGVHVYYTGTSSTFAATNEFVSGGLTPASSLVFSSSQSLVSGTNYFWVVYDMNNTGTIANAIGAQMPSNPITVGGSVRALTASPNGTGNFAACAAYPTFTAWYKADNNVTGNPVSAWNSSTGTFNLTQATLANRPAVVSGSTNYKLFNYNKRLNFVSANSSYLSNTGNSPDLLGNTGTVFTVLEKGTTSGTSFCYRAGGVSTTDARYQFKPQFRYQSGISGTGTTMDMYGSSHSVYANYFPSEFLSSSAFVNTSISTNTGMSIRINSKLYNTCDNCNDATYYPSFNSGLYVGSNSGTGEFVDNDMAEIITCSATLSASQISRVESYLALKYGVTLGGNTGISSAYNYLASDGTTIFNKTTNTGYTNDIAGIGRDDGSGFNQKQSISVNISDPVSIGLSSIATENSANAATFGNDKSFLIWGNNGLAVQSTTATSIPAASSTLPATIETRLARVWKAQATNFGGVAAGDSYKTTASPAVTVGFETSLLTGYLPISNLRLLTDNDGTDFSNATIYTGAVLNGTRVEFSGVVFSSSKKFFTLASINKTTTTLPIELLTFTAECFSNDIILNWVTASEINNNHFDLERSSDAINFYTIAQVPGHNTSIQMQQYQFTDNSAPSGVVYYRLKQVDNDLNEHYHSIIFLENECNKNTNSETAFTIYPNPASGNSIQLAYSIKQDEEVKVIFYNVLGEIISDQSVKLQAKSTDVTVYTGDLTEGIYFLQIESHQLSNKLLKIIRQ